MQNKTAAAASPDSSLPLGFAASQENLGGSHYTFFGTSGPCNGSTYYQFSNLNGPFDSAADNLVSGANCLDAYYWSRIELQRQGLGLLRQSSELPEAAVSGCRVATTERRTRCGSEAEADPDATLGRRAASTSRQGAFTERCWCAQPWP